MKYNNLGVIRTSNGGSAWVIALEPDVIEKIGQFVVRDDFEHLRDSRRCVIPQYDLLQSTPIVRSHTEGYRTGLGCALALITGWHMIWRRLLPYVRPIYYANSEGMRLIAKYGDPHKAYASL